MTDHLLWIFAFLVPYWTFCIAWGIRCGRKADTATAYFIADRSLPPWIFAVGATVVSFSGWIIIGHPALIFRDGFPYAFVGLCAITIPLAGVLFLKRQWLLSRRYGYVSPGEMFSDYFGGNGIRWLVALIALTFAIPFAGVQLKGSGILLALLTGGAINADFATWILAVPLIIYLAAGGLRGVAFVSILQAGLFAAGIAALGIAAYLFVGGFDSLLEAIARLAASDLSPWSRTATDQSPYVAMPGVIQFTRGLGEQIPSGGPWTGVMTLSLLLAFMGIQASPTFSMWAFATRSPGGFGVQQVWLSGAVMGALLLFFSLPQGIGAHFLGASAAATEAGITVADHLPALGQGEHERLVPALINVVGDASPWFVGLLALCALAAMQSTAAAHINAGAGMLTRDTYLAYLAPDADAARQKRVARVLAGLMMLVALLLATFATNALVVLAALALGMGFQLLPTLAAVCWFPWITRQGAITGLVFGMVAVLLTEELGIAIAAFFGLDLPWGRWPWTIHSAAWGMFFNLVTCSVVSFISRNGEARTHRERFHEFLASQTALPANKRVLRPVAWSAVILWLFFGIGPGAVLGNDLFGLTATTGETWEVGMPPIWIWQIVAWVLGVLVLWFLAYRMEMASGGPAAVEALTEDQAGTRAPSANAARALREPEWYWTFAAGVLILVIAQWTFG